ncbi:MAG: hypothetical protein ACRD0I_04750, partial [Acidimicrobiales bacterium]
PDHSVPDAVEALRDHGVWLALWGGPGIGFASDEIPAVLTAAPPSSDGLTPSEAQFTQCEQLEATVRPTSSQPLQLDSGIVALRWFEVNTIDWEEFLDLSASAWPDFEASYDSRILGLFRSRDAEVNRARALLATHYASLSEWERSRQAITARDGAGAIAGQRFRRRQHLTRWTLVRVGLPISPLT